MSIPLVVDGFLLFATFPIRVLCLWLDAGFCHEQIAQNMDEFERQLNDLDMQGTMINATMAMGATSTPVDEVDSLISQVADEAGLELGDA